MIAATVLAAAALAAPPPVAFGFDHVSAAPNDRVTVHAQGLLRPERLYLVRSDVARSVRSRFDARLAYVGRLVPSRRHAMLIFSVPPLDTGVYVPWCAGCGNRRSGELRVNTPPATPESCPVTVANGDVPRGLRSTGWNFHGNKLLAAAIPTDGSYADGDRDGIVDAKIIWVAGGLFSPLAVRYVRIDVRGPVLDAREVPGTLTGFPGPSWASRMSFTVGCWKITGRVADVSLSFVVKVAAP